jgi:hypothetical protein
VNQLPMGPRAIQSNADNGRQIPAKKQSFLSRILNFIR